MKTPAEPSSIEHSSPARILIAEDERIVAMNLQCSLVRMGYLVLEVVASGEDAVANAIAQQPDLVLMDISLEGEMDGVEAARIIRERSNIPVVYLTAYSNSDIVNRAKVTQPGGYVLKPFVDHELREAVEKALKQRNEI
ncbi:MAG: response regulator [Planctomycetes bacterium]|nr:response regulator [Planctomycetota bacterium]